MTKHHSLRAAVAAISLCAASAPAAAEIITFKASDYQGGQHGLYTSTLAGVVSPYFSFQDDVRFIINTDTNTATLIGTAINSASKVAVLDISLGNPLGSIDGTGYTYKAGGGGYNAATDTPDINFYRSGSGTITVAGTVFNLQSDPFAGQTLFQYGTGANDKVATEYGGSAWLLLNQVPNDHWDINFGLAAVPEPSTWGLVIVGFGVIGGAMRARTRKSVTSRSALRLA